MKYLKYIVPVAVVVITLVISGVLTGPPEPLPKWQFRTPEKPTAGPEEAVTRDDDLPVRDGYDISLGVGDEFTLEFEGNQTTGFSWMADYDRDKLESVRDEYVPNATPEGVEALVGGGGTHHFTYRAIEAGLTQLRFTYSRPWESVMPAQTVFYTVNIE